MNYLKKLGHFISCIREVIKHLICRQLHSAFRFFCSFLQQIGWNKGCWAEALFTFQIDDVKLRIVRQIEKMEKYMWQIFFYQSFEILMKQNLTIFIWSYAQRNHFVSNHLGFACIWSNYLYEFTVNFCEFSAPIFATLMYFAIRKVPERTASFKWGLETIKYLVEVRWKNQFFSLNIVVAVQIQDPMVKLFPF